MSNERKLDVIKTNYILFQNRSVHNVMPPLTLDSKLISRVQQTKFLGVYTDANLNWNSHINEAC